MIGNWRRTRKQWKESPPAGRVTDETDHFLLTTRKWPDTINTGAFALVPARRTNDNFRLARDPPGISERRNKTFHSGELWTASLNCGKSRISCSAFHCEPNAGVLRV